MSEGTEDENKVLKEIRAIRTTNENLLAEIRSVRVDLAERPTSYEIRARRRFYTLLIALFVFVTIQAYNFEIEQCGPGASAQEGISYFAHASRTDDFKVKQLQHLLSEQNPRSCDVTLPFAAHNQSNWPSEDNWLGFALFLAIFFALYLHYRSAQGAAVRNEAENRRHYRR